jgi:hypothetical protein
MQLIVYRPDIVCHGAAQAEQGAKVYSEKIKVSRVGGGFANLRLGLSGAGGVGRVDPLLETETSEHLLPKSPRIKRQKCHK